MIQNHKKSTNKDYLKRQLFRKFEMKRLVSQCLFKELPDYRSYFVWKKNFYHPQTSKVQTKNRCILTNRGRGVYKKFRISRIKLRQLANLGLLAGVTKSSW